MEFGKHTLILLAALIGGAMSACDTTKMMTCLTGLDMGALAGMDQGMDPAVLKGMCSKMTTVMSCIEESTKDCSGEIKAQMGEMSSKLGPLKEMCNEDSPCSITKIMKCFEGFPMTQPDNIDYKTLCKKMPTAMTCIDGLKARCNSDEFKQSLVQASSQFESVEGECKNMYGDNYATETGTGTQTGGENKGDEGNQENQGNQGNQAGAGGNGGDGNGVAHVTGLTVLLFASALVASLGL